MELANTSELSSIFKPRLQQNQRPLTNNPKHYTARTSNIYTARYAPIIYPPLPWLLRGGAEGYVTMVAEDIWGAYPQSRCGISDLYHVTAALQKDLPL